jgi:hypothetical protein
MFAKTYYAKSCIDASNALDWAKAMRAMPDFSVSLPSPLSTRLPTTSSTSSTKYWSYTRVGRSTPVLERVQYLSLKSGFSCAIRQPTA